VTLDRNGLNRSQKTESCGRSQKSPKQGGNTSVQRAASHETADHKKVTELRREGKGGQRKVGVSKDLRGHMLKRPKKNGRGSVTEREKA